MGMNSDTHQVMYNSLNRNFIMFSRQADKISIEINEFKDQHEGRIVDKMHDPNKVSK